MRCSTSLPRLNLAAGAAAALLASFPGWVSTEAAAGNDTAQPAVWAPKQIHFVFQGFTTKYSCQGLQDKVRKALLELGARPDLKVTEGACTNPAGGPEPFPNVDVKMQVLKPAPAAGNDSHPETVTAHWKAVDLRLDRDPLSQAEDCELLEQIKHTFLPLFTTRNVDYQSTCIPHQVSPGGTWLRAKVLTADGKDKRTVAGR